MSLAEVAVFIRDWTIVAGVAVYLFGALKKSLKGVYERDFEEFKKEWTKEQSISAAQRGTLGSKVRALEEKVSSSVASREDYFSEINELHRRIDDLFKKVKLETRNGTFTEKN